MNNEDPYVRMLLGQYARKAAFNYVVQRAGENRAAIIGNTTFASEMSFDASAEAPHVLVLCDVVIRPHLVIASDHLTGMGVSGILTDGALSEPDEWLKRGKVILNNMPIRR